MDYKKTMDLGKKFSDKLLRETFTEYFNKEQKTAANKIIDAFNSGMSTDDYTSLYENTIKEFSKKTQHHLKFYLSLCLIPNDNDCSYLMWSEKEILRTYREIR